jgi:hypothetical protein
MKRARMLPNLAALLALVSLVGPPADAQDQPRSATGGTAALGEVAAGTHFLVGLEDTLSTRDCRSGERFRVKTLEPLRAADGTILRPGTQLRGHIDRVDAGQKTGRARMWLTFDDVKTPNGRIPLVADVIDVPGVHSVRWTIAGKARSWRVTAADSNRPRPQQPGRLWAQPRASPRTAGGTQRSERRRARLPRSWSLPASDRS